MSWKAIGSILAESGITLADTALSFLDQWVPALSTIIQDSYYKIKTKDGKATAAKEIIKMITSAAQKALAKIPKADSTEVQKANDILSEITTLRNNYRGFAATQAIQADETKAKQKVADAQSKYEQAIDEYNNKTQVVMNLATSAMNSNDRTIEGLRNATQMTKLIEEGV